MSIEYYIRLRNPAADEEAERALLTHPFAELRQPGEIWIVPGTTPEWLYLARVFPRAGEFLLEFDFFALTGERLKPWIEQLKALGGFELVDDDNRNVERSKFGW